MDTELSEASRELTVACDAYEIALVTNDVDTLMDLFWDSPDTVRYGPTENLYGSEEIQAFRQNRPSKGLERKVERREITLLDAITGYCNIEFSRETPAGKRIGRQTQFWRKFPEIGWKVVSAHVSLMAI
ncbi:oxalurate catabolism protein HpxZ [Pelagicoccus albus]|uniref:Oxalurate catabolism protein HpxZ n=1 Tax=Pelagicoccus albus TaxID=415222 RepID=A0A7X1BBG2_9BACT|nr:oxalurate catabolism protein HpxZ [Pelagicoccus albus]MBC2607890.1 oxalurate catabolism protein HpxZ [Pelagicoccus albus]